LTVTSAKARFSPVTSAKAPPSTFAAKDPEVGLEELAFCLRPGERVAAVLRGPSGERVAAVLRGLAQRHWQRKGPVAASSEVASGIEHVAQKPRRPVRGHGRCTAFARRRAPCWPEAGSTFGSVPPLPLPFAAAAAALGSGLSFAAAAVGVAWPKAAAAVGFAWHKAAAAFGLVPLWL